MNTNSTGGPEKHQDEIAALTRTLHETQRRLAALTGGAADLGRVPGTFPDSSESQQSAEVLRLREERFHLLARATNDAIWDWDLATDRLWWNEGIEKLFGYRRENVEPTSQSWTNRIHPRDVARVTEGVHYAIDHGFEVWTDEYRFRCEDGSYAYVLDRGHIIRNGAGQGVRMIGGMTDLTERKRIEELLRASEANMATAQRIAHFGSWELDLTKAEDAAQALRWSNEMFRIAGYEPGAVEVSKELFFRLVHPEDRALVQQSVATALRERREYSVVHRLIQPGGQVRVVQETAQIFFDEQTGRPLKIVGTAHDITERRRAEAALRESQHRFASAFEHAPIGVALISPEGRWLKVNRALCALVGYSEAELLERTFQDITHPDDLAEDLENVRQMLAGELHTYQMEKRYFHARGHLVTVLLSVSLVRDGQGEPCYFIAQIQDITERKRDEEDLLWKTAFLEAQVNSSIDGIMVVDESGKTALQNQRFVDLFRMPPDIADDSTDENRLRWVMKILKHPDQFIARVVYLYAHPDETSWDEIEFQDGTFLDRYSAPVVGKDGKYYGRIWTFRDITERKQSEAALGQAHRELVEASRRAGRAEMATGVLHNVGNVLNSINVASSCLAANLQNSKAPNLQKVVTMLRAHETDLGAFLTSDPKGQQVPAYLAQLAEHLAGEQATALKELAQLQKNIQHIKEVVTAQQNGAKGGCKSETVQVTDLVEDTLRMDLGEPTHRDIQVVKQFDAAPSIIVDKHKVLQILMNLLRNAKQSCQASGRTDQQVTLRVTNGDARVRIALSDNGLGISPENLSRIFSHGFTTKKDGHGFGLHSAIAAAKEMGGELRVQSEGVGRGATFTLELPLNPFTNSP